MKYRNFMTSKNVKELKRQTKEQKSNFFKHGSMILASAGLLIPAFYLFGLRFYDGILSVYGIQPNTLALDTMDIYVYGYYAVAHVASDYLKSLQNIFSFIVLIVLVLIILAIIYRSLKLKQCCIKVVNFFKLDNSNQDEFSKKIFISYNLVVGFFIILAIFGMLWILIPYGAYKKGKSSQSQIIKDYSKKGCYYNKEDNWNTCTQILDKNGTKIFEGLLIVIKGDRVAMYKNDGSHVFTLTSNQTLYRAKLLDINITK